MHFGGIFFIKTEQYQGEIPTCRLRAEFIQVGEKLKVERDICS
jgi:hypothetical protein